MKNLFIYFSNIKLRTKLIISFIFLITLPLCIVGYRYFRVSSNFISDLASKNVYEIIKKNNEIIDNKLLQTQENIFSLTVDKELYNTFTDIKPDSDYNILLMENRIAEILSKYFAHSQDIYSVHLATSYYTFNPKVTTSGAASKNFIPEHALVNSRLYHIAKQEEGRLHWVPTYDYADMFDIAYIKDLNIDYRFMFSVVEMFSSSIYDGSDYVGFDSDTEKPILIINYKEDFFQKVFNGSIPIEGSNYYVITKEGQIVSHQDQSKITRVMSAQWLDDMKRKGSGTDIIAIDGEKMLICYDTSRVTEWISVAMVPLDRLLDQVLPALRLNTFFTALVVIIISIILSYLITDRITSPIKILTQATKKVGEGNFGERIKEVGSSEFKEFIHTFNSMNEKIQKLITENYEIRIRETEAEITALNLQLDPHFMYNALNLISLVSIKNKQDEISEMIISLSNMLKYTVKNKKDIVPFKKDMEYLKGYINIMSKRFEGKFKVEFNVEEELYLYSVPKFFMQPFVENSIVHGFDSVKSGGVLKISGWIDNNTRCFAVEDNGKGMDEQRILEIFLPDSSSVGIKNVDKRIKILYGEEFGVKIQSVLNKGTRVEIKLPLEKKEEILEMRTHYEKTI